MPVSSALIGALSATGTALAACGCGLGKTLGRAAALAPLPGRQQLRPLVDCGLKRVEVLDLASWQALCG